MRQDITNISISFIGIAKGKRKERSEMLRLGQLIGHNILTPEMFNQYERQAWSVIDSMGFKNVKTGKIIVNHGANDGEMTMIQLLPKQTQLIMR